MANLGQEKLQRLVDGELSIEQIRQLMITAENNPSQWREIACAVVEDQLFQRQFAADDRLAQEEESVQEFFSEQVESPQLSVSKETSKESEHKKSSGPLLHSLALAAGLLIALLTGYLAGSSRMPSNANLPIVQTPSTSNQEEDFELASNNNKEVNQSRDFNRISPASYVEFDPPNGETPKGQVPLYTIEDIRTLTGQGEEAELDSKTLRQLLPSSSVTDDLRKELGESGYQVKVEVKYVSGNLGEGRKFVVPMRTIRWVPGN